MALGFNNAPVNWDHSRTILSGADQFQQQIMGAAQSVMKGIDDYAAREKEKQSENDALEVLKMYGPQLGLDTSDEKALRAGVKSVGAGNLLKLAGEGQQREEDDKTAIEASKALGLWQPGMTAGDAKALVGGKQTEAKWAYQNAMTQQMQASTAATTAEGQREEQVRKYLQEQLAQGNQLTPEGVLAQTGDAKLAQTVQEMLGKDAFAPSEVTLPGGTRMVQTSRNSFMPDPGQRALQPHNGEYMNLLGLAEQEGIFELPQEQLTPRQKSIATRLKRLESGSSTDWSAVGQGMFGGSPQGSAAAPVQPSVTQPAAKTASGYASPDAVRAAVRGGQLTREQAMQILQQDFGMQ